MVSSESDRSNLHETLSFLICSNSTTRSEIGSESFANLSLLMPPYVTILYLERGILDLKWFEHSIQLNLMIEV